MFGLNTQESGEQPAVAVFYPGVSLKNQLAAWHERRGSVGFESSSARSLSGIRRALGDVEISLIDATEKPEQVVAAFQLSAARLGGYSVALYTEQAAGWLELFVRRHGSLLLLGPLDAGQWDDVFGYLRNTAMPQLRARVAADHIDRTFARSAEIGLCNDDFSCSQDRRIDPAQLWSTQTPRRQAS